MTMHLEVPKSSGRYLWCTLECVKQKKVSILLQKALTFVPRVKLCHKKNQFEGHNHLLFTIEVFKLPTALPQGQLAEVPLYFHIFTKKVGGITILA